MAVLCSAYFVHMHALLRRCYYVRAGPVCIPELVSLAVEILEGLTELHAANIWHLDLKPPNILLDQYGHAYLSDFGISHALRTLEACTALTNVAGTPHYM